MMRQTAMIVKDLSENISVQKRKGGNAALLH
jgi:hypothetical protein